MAEKAFGLVDLVAESVTWRCSLALVRPLRRPRLWQENNRHSEIRDNWRVHVKQLIVLIITALEW